MENCQVRRSGLRADEEGALALAFSALGFCCGVGCEDSLEVFEELGQPRCSKHLSAHDRSILLLFVILQVVQRMVRVVCLHM